MNFKKIGLTESTVSLIGLTEPHINPTKIGWTEFKVDKLN